MSPRALARAEEIAAEYAAQWLRDRQRLNCQDPEVLCKATDHIPQQIEMIQELERSLGFDLFRRIKGRLHPTPEGQLFFREVEHAFLGLVHLRAGASMIDLVSVDGMLGARGGAAAGCRRRRRPRVPGPAG